MSRVGRWWRKCLAIEPAIQPESPESFEDMLERYGARSADQLWETSLAQSATTGNPNTPNSITATVHDWLGYKAGVPASERFSETRFEVNGSKFETPTREGKPATIYIYVDPETGQSLEFESVQEIDGVISDIRKRYHDKIKAETARLKKIRDSLS